MKYVHCHVPFCLYDKSFFKITDQVLSEFHINQEFYWTNVNQMLKQLLEEIHKIRVHQNSFTNFTDEMFIERTHKNNTAKRTLTCKQLVIFHI
jgi:ferric iron reductase protein FhuF